jgi:ArsR family metal-binding transcriptional regulator
MLIEQYELRVESPPCDPGSERWSAFAQLSTDISAVLPYLNATLKGAIYDHDGQVLSWRSGGRVICFRPREIAVSNLEDRNEAQRIVERMVELANRTWEQREHLQPSLARREPLKALDVYKLLPGQNCKACGQPTCFTFALKLVAGQAEIESCAPLFNDEYRSKRDRLLEMLEAAGVAMPSAGKQ